MHTNRTSRGGARTLLLIFACGTLAALPWTLPATALADPGTHGQRSAAAIGTADWCRDYERGLLGLVDALTEHVLFNLRLALEESGAEPGQVERVISFAKHPVIASYVEQKHGRAVMGRYESLLDKVGCLKR